MLNQNFFITALSLLIMSAFCPLRAMIQSEQWPYPSQKSYLKGKLPPYKYKPLSRPNSTSAHHVIPYSSYKTLRSEKPYDRLDRCYTVALTETLGITGLAHQYLPITEASDLITQCNVVEKYYYPIKKPKKGCLVVFANSKRIITHFALVTHAEKHNHSQTCRVKSKLGYLPNIHEHLLFDVPLCYRNKVSFYQLQKKFKHNKNLLLQSIQHDIAQSKSIRHITTKMEKVVLLLAQGIDVHIKNDKQANKQPSLAAKILFLFKYYICLDVNTRNARKNSPLILASMHNQCSIMQVLLSLGARINHQNMQGQTALMCAISFNHIHAVQLLLAHKANLSLKDKGGWTALDYAIAKKNQDLITLLSKKTKPKI